MPQKPSIITYALANSLLTVLYVILVGTFMFNAQYFFVKEPSPFIPIGILLLFVFSASVCGSLMLGRPLLWYLDGRKKEALSLFAYTLAFFLIAGAVVFVASYLINL